MLEEQKGMNFSSVAPSSEELWAPDEKLKPWTLVHGFRLETEKANAYLKGSEGAL